jgi:hypothetical protein
MACRQSRRSRDPQMYLQVPLKSRCHTVKADTYSVMWTAVSLLIKQFMLYDESKWKASSSRGRFVIYEALLVCSRMESIFIY